MSIDDQTSEKLCLIRLNGAQYNGRSLMGIERDFIALNGVLYGKPLVAIAFCIASGSPGPIWCSLFGSAGIPCFI